MTTPEEGLAAIHARFGAHPGHRALHAKGVICAATFTATPEAAALTRAGHMAGEPIRGDRPPLQRGRRPDRSRLRARRPRPRRRLSPRRRHAHRHPRPDPSPLPVPGRARLPRLAGDLQALALGAAEAARLRRPQPAGARRAAEGQQDPRPVRQLRRAPLLPLPRLQLDRRRRQRAIRPLHLAADRRRARHPQVRGQAPGPDYLFDELAAAARARAGADAARGPDRRRRRRCRRPLLGLAGRPRTGHRRHARDHRRSTATPTTRSSWTRCGSSTGSSPRTIPCCATARPSTTCRTGAAPAEPERGRTDGRVTSLIRMRVGLVLGAGGVQGGAWLTGALDALADETGWDPATADVVVGTSAGSVIGSLCVAGIPPWFMVAHSAGETFDGVVDARGRPAAEADRSGGARYRLERALPPLGPGSWPLALATMRAPHRYPPAALFAGWAPRGFISTEPVKEIIRTRRPLRLERSPEPLGGRLRLRHRSPGRVRTRRRSGRGARRGGRRLMRDPRLLPPGRDRGPPLRRRRHVLDLEPRPAPRPRARPRDLPQPDLLAASRRAPGTRSSASPGPSATPRGAGSAARPRSCAPTAPTWS